MIHTSIDQTAPTETRPPAPADISIEQLLREQARDALQENTPDCSKLKTMVGLHFKARQLNLAERKFQIQLERHRVTLTAIQEKLGLPPRASGEVTEEESRAILAKLDEILGLRPAQPSP